MLRVYYFRTTYTKVSDTMQSKQSASYCEDKQKPLHKFQQYVCITQGPNLVHTIFTLSALILSYSNW